MIHDDSSLSGIYRDIPHKYPLYIYKVYMGLIIICTIPRVPPFSHSQGGPDSRNRYRFGLFLMTTKGCWNDGFLVEVQPPKTNTLNPKSGGFFRCFSFSKGVISSSMLVFRGGRWFWKKRRCLYIKILMLKNQTLKIKHPENEHGYPKKMVC